MMDSGSGGTVMDTFTLTIELGNDAMREAADVADALEQVAAQVRDGYNAGRIMDVNGNTVGRYEASWACTGTDPTTIGPDYQGWTNRETWAASLWISNERGLYEGAREVIAAAVNGDDLVGPYTAGNALEEWITNVRDDNRESAETGMEIPEITMMDREVGSWWRVNWREVADGLMED